LGEFFKENHEVCDSTVIDVRICVGNTIGGRPAENIFMNSFLEVDAGSPKSPDNDVRANTSFPSGVTHRICQSKIGGVIPGCFGDARLGALYQFRNPGRTPGYREKKGEHKDEDSDHEISLS